MADGPGWTRRWQPWAVAGFGLSLLGVSAVHAGRIDRGLAVVLVESSVPVVLSLGLVGFGWWLTTTDLEPRDCTRVVAWSGGAALVLSGLGAWAFYLVTSAGLPSADASFIVLSTAAFGGTSGAVIGLYEARRRRQHRRTQATYRSLRSVGIDLTRVDDARAAVRLTLDATASILGRPFALVWFVDDHEDVLRAVDMTARTRSLFPDLDEPPVHTRGDPIWELFERGEQHVIDELDPDVVAVDAPIASAQVVPLGEHGVLTIGATEPAAFDETDVDLADILATNLRVTLDRLDRQQALATREERLRTVVENVPLVLFVIEDDRRIGLAEGRGLDSIGFESGDLTGSRIDELFGEHDVIMDAVGRAFDGEEVHVDVTLEGAVFETAYLPVTDGHDAVRRVLGVAVDVTERVHRERSIRWLHQATREMIGAADESAIAERAVDAAEHVLDMPLTALWLAADDRDALEPVAWTDACTELFGDIPSYVAGDDSLAWAAFESGETRNVADVRAAGPLNPETPLGSELVVPVGEYGVINIASTTRDAYDDADVALANLLAANTAAAIERVLNERELARRNDQLEFFNSILRHDVLNGMTVIRARGELLAEGLHDEQRAYAETIVSWCDDVVDIVSRVRRVIGTLTAERELPLEAVDAARMLREEVARVRSTYPAVAFELDVPDGVHVRADELLADVVGNVVSNAVDHNDEAGLRVAVALERNGDVVTVRVADNGSGVADDRKEVIFRRGETGHAKATGSGFGLFFVDAMVEQYGGDVRVEDNDAGGATFVIELQAVE